MKQIKYLFLLLVLAVPTALLAEQQYEHVYVFGDSLSDTGNLASVVGSFPQPPYFENRVTNGLVAVEIMARRLDVSLETSLHLIGPASGSNYAVAGASAARSESIDLNAQVALFLANHGGVAPANALYVMFMGGNDIRKARGTTDWFEAVQIVDEAAQTIATQMQVLASSGAKNWLVVNAPDIGRIPETRLIAEATGFAGLPARTTALTKLFNDALKHQVKSLDEETVIEVERFDLYKLFGRIVKKSDKLGFTNSTDPCFSSQLMLFTPDCNYGANFDQFIYFDEIHPTARVHALVGEAMYRKVRDEEHEDKRKHKHKHKRKHKHEQEQEQDDEVESADDD